MRQAPGDPPLRIHMIRALLARMRLRDEKAGLRKPEPPKERVETIAKVLAFGETGRGPRK